MNKPLVSIIMPVYNSSKFLKDNIDSILKQTYTNLEVIIIDDCSTDDSYKIIKSYNDPRIISSKNNSNLGYIKTLNNMINLSKGVYIARHDSDDISHIKRIELQVNFLEVNKDYSLIGTNALFFGNKNKKTNYPTVCEEIKTYSLFGNPIIHPSVMFRKSIFQMNNNLFYDNSFYPSEDYFLWTLIMQNNNIANLPNRLIKYRCHDNNVSVLSKNLQDENNFIIRKNLLIKLFNNNLSINDLHIFKNLFNKNTNINFNEKKYLYIKILRTNSKNKIYSNFYLKKTIIRFWTNNFINENEISILNKIYIFLDYRILNPYIILSICYDYIRNFIINNKYYN